jgi:hypothetical protein
MLSKTIGIQYLWGVALLTYFYYKCFTKKDFSPILSIVTGLIIGMYNEALSFICFSMFFSYIAHQIIVKERVNRNCIFFLTPFLLGSIIMFTAPGSYAIVEVRNYMSPLQLLISDFWNYAMMIFTASELSPLFLISIICVSLLEKSRVTKIMMILCLIMTWISIWPISFQFGRRVSMLYMLTYFSVIAYYIANKPNQLKELCIRYYKFFYYCIFVMVILMLYIFGRYHYYEDLRFDRVSHYSQIGAKNIILKQIKFKGMQLIKIDGISSNPNQEVNVHFANVYGFDTVTVSK